ncbi:MAG: lytic murein transglycosylase [Ancrocorticia sp.]
MAELTARRKNILLWSGAGTAGLLGVGLMAVGMMAQSVPAASAASADAAGRGEMALLRSAGGSDAVAGGDAGAESASDEAVDETGSIARLASSSWVAEHATRLGIPERALAAYAGAAMKLAGEQPECGLDWATLAGIGQVESMHGTIYGGSIESDGKQRPAVIGIALDGATTAHIPDTDRGALDGDPVWDRAAGPMQIIPDTWRQYAADGNGDGLTDPQQIDDAALTAAHYLCAVGVDLRTDDGWIAAVGAYNDSTDYNHRVAEATSHYRVG